MKLIFRYPLQKGDPMYGLKKSVDFGFLNGEELIQVCISPYQVILKFTGEVSISAECILLLEDSEGIVKEIQINLPDQTKALVCLLGRSIVKVTKHEEGTVKIWFSGNYALSLNDSNKLFESYMVIGKGHDIIV